MPSGLSRTSRPSRRILAIVDALLIFCRPAGRDDSYPLFPLCIHHIQHVIADYSEQDDTFLAVILPQGELLDGERVSES